MKITKSQFQTIQNGVTKYANLLASNGYTINYGNTFFLWMKVCQISRLQDSDYPSIARTETGERAFPYNPDADMYFNDRSMNDSHIQTALKKVSFN